MHSLSYSGKCAALGTREGDDYLGRLRCNRPLMMGVAKRHMDVENGAVRAADKANS